MFKTMMLAAALPIFAGCATQSGAEGMAEKPSGAKLWSQNCVRCHNNRSPASYSDAEWSVAMRHMRVRANLTAEEERAILDFLQSAN